jgi:hypothetical protein
MDSEKTRGLVTGITFKFRINTKFRQAEAAAAEAAAYLRAYNLKKKSEYSS